MGLTISPEASAHSQAHSGDVSALCLLRVPDTVSGIERTVVLAGIGSQLLAYDLCSGQLLFCQRVMPDGMHLHGIAAERPASGGWDALLALHGDRHACVASLHLRDAPRAEVLCALPALRSWSLDARLTLLGVGPASRALVAVGMCDNSVEVHSLSLGAQQAAAQQPPATLLLRAESTERCLLYSLHLWTRLQANGDVSYVVAAGTVFLDVLVWETPVLAAAANGSPAGHPAETARGSEAGSLVQAPVQHLLKGHRGSIHRVRWSPDGSLLASASDDRSVRVWDLAALRDAAAAAAAAPAASGADPTVPARPRHVLLGHGARLWDCNFAGGLLATASEDCTWRLWDTQSGACLCEVEGHRGRGIWHCLLHGGYLITGGEDGSIKCWTLSDWARQGADRTAITSGCSSSVPGPAVSIGGISSGPTAAPPGGPRVQHLALDLPPELATVRSGSGGQGEVVKCMALAGQHTLYVGTSKGRVHRAQLPAQEGEAVHWSTQYASPSGQGILMIAVLEQGGGHHLALCSHAGTAAVVIAPADAGSNEGGGVATEWQLRSASASLDVFWCEALGVGHVFSSDVTGGLTLWCLGQGEAGPTPVLTLQSPLKERAVVLAARLLDAASGPAATQQLLLATGDSDGGATAWSVAVPPSSVPAAPVLLGSMRGVHLRSPVRMLSVRSSTEILCAGSDDTLCVLGIQPSMGGGSALVVLRRDRLACLHTVDHECTPPGGHDWVLAGFKRADFVVYSSSHDAVVAKVPCGGWKPPSAASVRSADDLVFCYTTSGGALKAYRRLPAEAGGSPPRSLLRPHHGREANAVALLPGASGRTLACITGGEDCTLRVLLHPPGAAAPAGAVPATCSGEPSCFGGSLLLGEQASGASVRTMSLVPLGPPRSRRRSGSSGGSSSSSSSGGSSSSSSSSGSSYKGSSAAAAGGAGEPAGGCSNGQQWLLLAGGSKAVLSAWVLRWRHPPATVPAGRLAQATWQADTPGAPRTTSVAPGAQPQLEWEWLGTRPPPGRGLRPKSLGVGLSTPVSDQRCLAVSAFLPSPADRPAASAGDGPACGAGVAFLVMASSDATLCMLALELERRAHGPNSGECSRAWQTVANLEYHQAPVLCTAHVATEAPAETVAAAAPSASGIGSGVAPQAAPQRARRRHLVFSGASDGGVALWDLTGAAGGFAPARHGAAASGGDVPALRPALALPGLHRSGVNAISAVATGPGEVTLLTAGDDQAICVSLLGWRPAAPSGAAGTWQVLCCVAVPNAHSSALRGAWTDGSVAFTVGLDQRVRRWRLARPPEPAAAASSARAGGQEEGEAAVDACRLLCVEEAGSHVTQVLEPNALDVLPAPGGAGHDVCVTGRGTQLLRWRR